MAEIRVTYIQTSQRLQFGRVLPDAVQRNLPARGLFAPAAMARTAASRRSEKCVLTIVRARPVVVIDFLDQSEAIKGHRIVVEHFGLLLF